MTCQVLPSVKDSFEARVLTHVLDSKDVVASSRRGRVLMPTLAEWCTSDDSLRVCILDTQIMIAMAPHIP